MKVIFPTVIFLLIAAAAPAQTHSPMQPVSYEAAGWKTRMLDHPELIIAAAPPSTGQTKSELAAVRKKLAAATPAELAAIKYWDAGAPAHRWNQVVLGLIFQKQETLLRQPASWMNLAIYNATILAWKEKLKYKRRRPAEQDLSIRPLVKAPLTYSYPCEHSVTAAAAAHVLAYFFPAKKDSILQMAKAASQSRINAGVQFQSDADAGWAIGVQVAKEIIEKAINDGSAIPWDGKMNRDPRKWTGAYPLGITLPQFVPIVLRSADQFRLPPPPDFEMDMQELKSFKQNFNSQATAYYWATHGPEVWNDLAAQKMFEYRISDNAPEVSRIYTVLNVAYHDAVIAIFDSKYAYWGIRPDQYDTTYKPLISTPPFPGYPSGHAGGAGTTAAIMEYFFPADAKLFWQMAQECADSRFYAGIHFRTDNEAALKMGRELGRYVVATWMKE